MAEVIAYGAKHANVWNAVAAGAGDASTNHVNLQHYQLLSAFGNANAATTISLQYSQDGTNWYTAATVVLAGAGDFCFDVNCCAKYARLKTSGAATITATMAAKAS